MLAYLGWLVLSPGPLPYEHAWASLLKDAMHGVELPQLSQISLSQTSQADTGTYERSQPKASELPT